MFLTRLVLTGVAALTLTSLTGCLTHTRLLYQPKPFKMATVPSPAADASGTTPAPAPVTTGSDLQAQ